MVISARRRTAHRRGERRFRFAGAARPDQQEHPCGPFSGVRPVFAARRRRAMRSGPPPANHPFAETLFQLSSSVCSSFISEESGTPVQSAITVATVRTSTSSPSSGLPCWTAISAV